MNTHVIILECDGTLPEADSFPTLIDHVAREPLISYFGRNGKRLYSNPKRLMDNLRGKFFIVFSFQHLLQLDSDHAIGVIKAALKLGWARTVTRDCDAISVTLP